MISILIPVFNYNIAGLVTKLHNQASTQEIQFEIIVMEDGSVSFVEQNQTVTQLTSCRHIILPQNVGRSAIRNKLADEARYDHLLFIDCDSDIPYPDYLSKYLSFCRENTVVLGGRIYDENNTDKAYSLIRKYGMLRERNDLKNEQNRKKHPMFTTPNFLITKDLFHQVRFDEDIEGYGHEDTLFGIRLKALNIEYYFIDNPVVHAGLDENHAFIDKSRKAIANLYRLYCTGKYPVLATESKLLHFFIRLQKLHLTGLFALKYDITRKLFEWQLCRPNPSLFLFDLFKLLYLCKLAGQK